MKKNSIKEVENIYHVDKEKMLFTDHLATDRTALANERTFLSYIRTALAFAAGGFGLIKFSLTTATLVIGWILCFLGIVTLIIGGWRFIKFYKSINKLSCNYIINEKQE